MRSIGMLAGAMLAGAASSAVAAPRPPAGLTYLCGGAPVEIVYNGQGYLPGSTVRTPYATPAGQEPAQAPRATAALTYGGHQHRMVADFAEDGIRYRSAEPVDDAYALVWAAQGETAWIAEVPLAPGGAERNRVECTRMRSVASSPANAVAPAHR